MRRLCVILAGIAMVPTGLACQHTAGKCDCQPPLPHCTKYGLFVPEAVAEPIQKQEMLPPAPPPAKMVPAAVVFPNSDISEPVKINPSAGAYGRGG
jgi:hypothetical protein